MTEIINFNKKRKAKLRADEAQQAAENRAKYGRTKEQKRLEATKAERLKQQLDGHKRETEEE